MYRLLIALCLVSTTASAVDLKMSPSELECMSLTVYGEARGESKMGQLLVMDVIYNRKESGKYPNHLCDVIKQHRQFSFWKGKYRAPRNKRSYSKIKQLVFEYDTGVWKGLSGGSMWYHADHITPKWSKSLEMVLYVDKHIFYK